MAYLITHSMLSAWKYQYECFEAAQESATADFLAALNREEIQPTEAMLNGREFEAAVYSALPDIYPAAPEVADIIKGSAHQVRLSRRVNIDGEEFLLYGILDALRSGTIFDIKYLSHSVQSSDLYGKWLTSTQHPMYFALCPEADTFMYVGSDGHEVYTETYRRKDTPDITDTIREFVSDLKASGLWETYTQKWRAK